MQQDGLESAVLEAVTAMRADYRLGEAMVGRVGNVGALLALLRQLEGDDTWLRRVARHSYRHALGFDKLVIIPAWPAGQLRMHVWWPSEPRVVEHVHNHRFSFASVVVTGRLRNNIYTVGDRGLVVDKYRRYAEDAAIVAQQWQFSDQGSERVGLSASVEMPPGATYSMYAGTLHRIEISDSLTVTLFVESPALEESSAVLVGPTSPQPSTTRQIRFSEAALRDRLDRLIGELGTFV